MKAKENHVYKTALQFSRNIKDEIPEAVIFGYAKLLSLDESQVKNLVSDECMEDIEGAHKWFSNNKLDLNLIKSGLLLLTPLIPYSQAKEKYSQFRDFLESEEKKTSSSDILSKANELTYIPFSECFKQGKELQDIFEYQNALKEKKELSDKEEKTEEHIEAKSEDSTGKEKEEPKHSLSKLSRKYRELSAALLEVVKGQDQAVLKFVQGYSQGDLLKETGKENHPKSYFFFFGPPGVGKTLLAETAANNLGIPYKIFNMSEYASHQAHQELIGVSRFYDNSSEGSLVKFVRENPECLLIFDEIEKAHINVIRQFLQILGSGSIYNVNRRSDVSFKDTTIIFTSNVGKELYADRSINLSTLPEKVLIDAIQNEKNSDGELVLPPEMCSRIASGNTILFNHLSVQHLAEMVRDSFDRIVLGMEEKYGVRISYSKELPLLFLYNRGGEIDARVAVGQSEGFLKNEIYELMRQLENRKMDNEIRKITIDIEWKGMDADLRRLFKNDDKAEALIFSDNNEIAEVIDTKRYQIHRTSDLEEANELLKNDISAVFIDPFLGKGKEDGNILSISDYNTAGVQLFHTIAEKQTELPIYMLEMGGDFSEVDRTTFLQEGAFGTITIREGQLSSFKRQFVQIMEELYMEKESKTFSQRGWVIDFNTKQEITDVDSNVKILFYGLKKRMAVDIESRGSILSEAERPNISFSDVIGAEKAKEELEYFVKYLKNPKQFLMNGGKPPKGVLLYGPPGTGKTMLARAMAGESDVTFLQTSAAEFKNQYVGESEANIRRIFAKAKRYAPSIIFIDEIDAIGKRRIGSEFTSHTESMLNTLLTEMDGFSVTSSTKPVFVLAATNYGAGSEKDGIAPLDEALIRRFDNKIYVDLPKEAERKKYIMLMADKMGMRQITEEIAQNLAERTTGQSLAILQNVIELARRNVVKEDREVTDDDMLTALEEYIHGEKKEHTPEYYREVAIHETGHAYVSYISGDKPTYITIESRGDFGGYMQHANQEDVPSYTKEELLSRIRTSLAGRAAEQVFFGKTKALNTGASSDLSHATEYAWKMICSYGMYEDQLIVMTKQEVLNSPMANDYVTKVNEILKTELKNTIEIIENAKPKIQEIADVLVKENRLTGAQFEELMEK